MTEPITILITDMAGSTALTQSRGDERAMDLIRAHERITRDVVARRGGREIKSMGDGFLIAFESASDALACALQLREAFDDHNRTDPEQSIELRFGLNAGSVIEEGGDLYGTAVNATARITAKARKGQILVSETVRNMCVGDGCEFVDRGLFWLKGLGDRWRLFEATADGAASQHVAEGRTPFIDREDERSTLRAYVDAVLEGRGGVCLLTGDPGTGKTRLAEEVSAEASGRGVRTFVGRCFEATRSHPFAPFVEILASVRRNTSAEEFRSLLGEVAGEIARVMPDLRRQYDDLPPSADLPPEQQRQYLFASMREVLASISRRDAVLIHIDDLHWADEMSLLFLEQLAADLSTLPVLVVATFTQPEIGSSQQLQATVDRLIRRRMMERLTIGPLGPEHTRQLIAAMTGLEPPDDVAELLHRETEGNPFFVEEVVRHLIEQDVLFDAAGGWNLHVTDFALAVPETIRLTVGRRLETLSDTARRILVTAALIGRAFGFDLLEALVQTTEDELLDALDEAEHARIVRSSSEGGAVAFRFEHELIRQTLIAGVSLARRQVLHLAIADAIERVFPDTSTEHATDLAYHLEEAGRRADPDRTSRALVLAGERAHEAGAYEEAIRYFDRALSLIAPDAPAARAPILTKLGMSERSLGQSDDAMATWGEALDAYEATGDLEAAARLCLDAGVQVSWWSAHRSVRDLIDRGLRLIGDEDVPLRAGLVALSGIIASHRGDYAAANETLADALAIARRHDDDRILGMVLYSKAVHHFNYLENHATIEFGLESIDLLRRSGDLWNLTNALGFVGQSMGFVGRYEEARKITEGASELARRLGNWVAYVYLDRARAWYPLSRAPDPDQLVRDGERDLELGRKLGYNWLCQVGYTRMSFGAFARGRWDEALDLANESAKLERGAGEGHTGRLVLLHAYRGERERAIAAFDSIAGRFPQLGDPAYVGSVDTFLAAIEGMAVLGEYNRVAPLYPLALQTMSTDKIMRGWDYRVVEAVVGVAAACADRWDEAEEHLASAVELADGLPYPLEEAETRRLYAWVLIRRGRPQDLERARLYLDEALAMYSKIGMPAHEALAESMLAQIA